ncbi:uncharacterized, partial [Tachysurus ichikawai]
MYQVVRAYLTHLTPSSSECEKPSWMNVKDGQGKDRGNEKMESKEGKKRTGSQQGVRERERKML